MKNNFSLYDDCVMIQLSDEVVENCERFCCGNEDLDDTRLMYFDLKNK